MKQPVLIAAAILLAAAGGAEASDPQRGEQLFAQCQACHSLDGDNGVGPTLKGIIGRTAGEVPGFRYSPAMRRAGVVWNAQTLERFLQDPQEVVRGNRMPFDSVGDARDRADITAYLEQAGK